MGETSVEHPVDDGDQSLVHIVSFAFTRLFDVEVDAFRDRRRNVLARIWIELYPIIYMYIYICSTLLNVDSFFHTDE